jgi:DNA-binding IclR family transcriptional regulator
MDVNTSQPGYSQTLGNGLRALEVLRDHPGGLGVNAVAQQLGVHRTVAYRLLTTLRAHQLAVRDADGRYSLGIEVLGLAQAVLAGLRSTAEPALAELADRLNATSYLTVAEGDDAVTVSTAEPRRPRMHVAYRVGSRHPLTTGAPGLAILAGRPYQPGERAEVTAARSRGFAVTAGELEAGAWGLAMPVFDSRKWAIACVGVVALTELDPADVVPAVRRARAAVTGRSDAGGPGQEVS